MFEQDKDFIPMIVSVNVLVTLMIFAFCIVLAM